MPYHRPRGRYLGYAQQRPGLSPRRHLPVRTRPPVMPDRSTKAGALTPATLQLCDGEERPLRRSTKAGALTPATLVHLPLVHTDDRPLNKGRGSHPGDTGTRQHHATTGKTAQQRPGLSPRRHLHAALGHADGVVRSTKAGALTPATPLDQQALALPGPRSTKAGALTPATHLLPAIEPRR